MLATVSSFGISGLDVYPVAVQVDASRGLPSTIIVGLPDNAVKESKERVRTAIKNSGYQYPSKRITINLSPADTKKEGPSFDLAIALGILAATDQIPLDFLNDFVFMGELALNGNLQSVKGVLSSAMFLVQSPIKKHLIIPEQNTKEARLIEGKTIYAAQTLKEVINIITNQDQAKPLECRAHQLNCYPNQNNLDFADVKGQYHVKRGLEIAAAGNHNCLLIGPPGSGKSMLAKRIPSILPDITYEEALESTKIHSALGVLKTGNQIINTHPFRSPHHTTSDVAIVGGGSNPRPGEVTLSHNGILFLDEFPEFSRSVLESLRQPLEDHYVTIARALKTVRFPSKFMLIAAMNPCPCGWLTDIKNECQCSSTQIQRYISKISGPLLDRIDIHLEVPALSSHELLEHRPAENSSSIKTRTVGARQIQLNRFVDQAINSNAYMNHKQIKKFCYLNEECKKFLKNAIDELCISARSYDKILKVARTIADLADEEHILYDHLAEAIQFRSLDRGGWG